MVIHEELIAGWRHDVESAFATIDTQKRTIEELRNALNTMAARAERAERMLHETQNQLQEALEKVHLLQWQEKAAPPPLSRAAEAQEQREMSLL